MHRRAAAALAIGLTIATDGSSWAQMTPPAAGPPDGATLFRQQCGTCHSLDPNASARQGPNLSGVFGRRAGSVQGFRYSPGFAKADFAWDEAHLDAYLTNPQSVIPGGVMPYRQGKAEVRTAIIGYLKDQH